jgi:DNA-binding beta-propeller fold protein YncE
MDHHFKGMWGSFGTGDGQFDQPRGIAVDSDGNVYVADRGNHRIQKFTSTGMFLDKWGEKGNGDGQFIHPHHIAFDSNNDIYITEELMFSHFEPYRIRIQKFTHTGEFIKQWGEAGNGDGQFFGPRGIAVESDDNDILVVDSNNFRIQKFNSNGEFITKWGRYEPGDDWNWHLWSPIDIAVDSNNDNYVTDAKHHLVKKFDRARNFIRKWGLRGIGDGEFDRPSGIATFSGNSLLVVDSFNNRVQEFSRNGVFVTKWGSFGNQPSQFKGPTGVAINKIDDMHYISDTGNHRVQRFHWNSAVP